MPENLKALRLRIRSVKKTKKITRAMEMVSAAKLRKVESIMKAGRPFMGKIKALIGRLALSTYAESHPLFQKSETGVPVLVVFTSDRGLCGAYNANILKAAIATLDADPTMKVIVLGRKGRDVIRKRYADRLVAAHTDLGGRPEGSFTDRVGAELLDGFRDGRYSRVVLCYAHYISTASNRPTVEQYLPFEAAAFGAGQNGEATQIDYLLEPSPEQVFEAVLPLYLRRKLFLTLAEAMTAEYASRMMAMNNATKNCDELTGSLTLRLNKARQAAITTEIIEIVSGAQALTG